MTSHFPVTNVDQPRHRYLGGRLALMLIWIVASLAGISNKSEAKPGLYLHQSSAWFNSEAGQHRLRNLLSHQDRHGCWPKNRDTTATEFTGPNHELRGTFDNSATVDEIRLLAKAYRITQVNEYRDAFRRGIRCILNSQYDNGGWPQQPAAKGYAKHITFNDGTMVGLMILLREVATTKHYDFVDADLRTRAQTAFDRGVHCILKCQIRVQGELTVWCAQHDAVSFQPRGARSYEHPSLSGGESAAVTCLLASIDNPSPDVTQALHAATAWFERSKLTGIRVRKVDGNKQLVKDPSARPLWARFYDIESNRPIFSGRDGVIKYDIANIEAERRNGYAWYGHWGERVAQCLAQ